MKYGKYVFTALTLPFVVLGFIACCVVVPVIAGWAEGNRTIEKLFAGNNT